ncbi:MAG: hypothetical protein HRU14_05275 [Planctomycetes bacterium]|nr:hypothetical protein [Planctomycetota bacterium]
MTPKDRHRRTPGFLSCAQFRCLIPLHVGGDLAQVYSSVFEAYLSACGACRDQVREYEDQQDLLRSYGRGGAPAWPRLWARLRRRLGRPSWERRWPRDGVGG